MLPVGLFELKYRARFKGAAMFIHSGGQSKDEVCNVGGEPYKCTSKCQLPVEVIALIDKSFDNGG
jgi:hypothetical protein